MFSRHRHEPSWFTFQNNWRREGRIARHALYGSTQSLAVMALDFQRSPSEYLDGAFGRTRTFNTNVLSVATLPNWSTKASIQFLAERAGSDPARLLRHPLSRRIRLPIPAPLQNRKRSTLRDQPLHLHHGSRAKWSPLPTCTASPEHLSGVFPPVMFMRSICPGTAC